MKHSPAAAQGFTLIEVIIAMTLLGLIMGMVAGALQLGSKSWDSGERLANHLEDMRLVHRFLSRQLGQSVLALKPKKAIGDQASMNEENRPAVLAFEGTADHLYFVGLKPAHAGLDGLYHYLLHRASHGDGQLVTQYALFNPDSAVAEMPEANEDNTVVLVEGVEALEWSYFGTQTTAADAMGDNNTPDKADKAAWYTEWDSTQKNLPERVRLRLTVKGQIWPDIVVALPHFPNSAELR